MADPGYPYRLFWSGAIHASFDGNNGWDFPVRQGTSNAGFIMGTPGAWERRDDVFTGFVSVPITGRTTVDITGGQTMSLWAQHKYGPSTQNLYMSNWSAVSVLVVPV